MSTEEIYAGDWVFSAQTRDIGFCRKRLDTGIAIVWCSNAAAVGSDGDFNKTESEYLSFEEAAALKVSKVPTPKASFDA